VGNTEFSWAMGGTALSATSFLMSDYGCDGSYNLSQYCNADIDAELQSASEIADLDERYTKAAEISAKIVPNPPDDEFVMVGASGPRSAAPSPLPPMLFELLGHHNPTQGRPRPPPRPRLCGSSDSWYSQHCYFLAVLLSPRSCRF